MNAGRPLPAFSMSGRGASLQMESDLSGHRRIEKLVIVDPWSCGWLTATEPVQTPPLPQVSAPTSSSRSASRQARPLPEEISVRRTDGWLRSSSLVSSRCRQHPSQSSKAEGSVSSRARLVLARVQRWRGRPMMPIGPAASRERRARVYDVPCASRMWGRSS